MAFLASIPVVPKLIFAYLIGCCYAIPIVPFLLWSYIKNPGVFRILRKTTKRPACLDDKDLGKHEFAYLQDVRLHYVVNGDVRKPLMLFLHGFPEFWYSWRHQLKEFCKDYRVVAVDMRGYNESDKPKGVGNYTMAKLTGDIKQLIPVLGYKSCVLVAHDWGGIIGHKFTMDNPDMVDKLVILNSIHPTPFEEHILSRWSQFRKSWYIFLFQLPYLPELLIRHKDMDWFQGVFTSSEWMKTTIMSPEDVNAYKYAFSHPGTVTATVNYYRGLFRGGLNRFKPIKLCDVPIMIIWGLQDVAINKEIGELAAEMYHKVIFKDVPEAGHFVQFDTPDIVNKHMREFLT